MTAQLPDIVRYAGKDYDLAGIGADGLFEPKDHGMRTWGEHDEYDRGFVVRYAVIRDRLFLEELKINLGDQNPALYGVVSRAGCGIFDSHYRKVRMPIRYSGGLLIASGFIDELNSHVGFHPAWKYEELHELKFEGGRLTSASDVSELMRGFRAEMRGSPLRLEPGASRQERAMWNDRCYSRRYTL